MGDGRVDSVDAGACLMVAVGLEVVEGEAVVGLVEGLAALGSANRNASARLYFDLEGLVVGGRLGQAVARVGELVDVAHEDVVQLLAHSRRMGLPSGLQGHEPEPISLGRMRSRLRPLLIPPLLVLHNLLLQLLQVREYRYRQCCLWTLLLVPH